MTRQSSGHPGLLGLFARRGRLIRVTAFTACLLVLQCATGAGTRMERISGTGPVVPAAPAQFKKIRIVLLDFRNSANLKQFDIIPDGDYGSRVVGRRHSSSSSCWSSGRSGRAHSTPGRDAPAKSGWETKEKEKAGNAGSKADSQTGDERKQDKKVDPAADPDAVRSGQVAREVVETELFKSGRFEIIPAFRLKAEIDKLRKDSPDDPLVPVRAARNLGVHYIFYGDLTNFELRQQTSYWKIPLWAILLIAAAFIKDDDLRAYAWYTILRVMATLPLNSPFWDKGVGWSNMNLNVDVGLNLRAVDTRTGSVAFARAKNITRTDKVRNLNLLIWASNRRLKITRSNAGRQIRFAAKALVVDVAGWTDGLPPVVDIPVKVKPDEPGKDTPPKKSEPAPPAEPSPMKEKPEPGSSTIQ